MEATFKLRREEHLSGPSRQILPAARHAAGRPSTFLSCPCRRPRAIADGVAARSSRPAEGLPTGGEDGVTSEATPEGQKSCTRCGTTSTPMWRKGPDGPATLCNACGVRCAPHHPSCCLLPNRAPFPFSALFLTRACPPIPRRLSRKPSFREKDQSRAAVSRKRELEALLPSIGGEEDDTGPTALMLLAGQSPEQSGEGEQMRNMTPPDTD